MRGEGIRVHPDPAIPPGSSPHARGGLASIMSAIKWVRLIPACAGRAMTMGLRWLGGGAHPRMRGEGSWAWNSVIVPIGSSPHARGGPLRARGGAPHRRLIPACAGRAGGIWGSMQAQAAHPRMRGEGFGRNDEGQTFSGSSPHARGGLVRAGDVHAGERLIPACAGRACVLEPVNRW